MNVLLITYYYKHKNAMASVRPIKLAKYFSALGHDVTVYTSMQHDSWTVGYTETSSDPNIKEIYAKQTKRWSFTSGLLPKIAKLISGLKKKNTATVSANADSAEYEIRENKKKSPIKKRIFSYLSWRYYFTLNKEEDACLFASLKKEYRRQGKPKFDKVIATYPSFGALLFGMWLKKRGRCREFIADFRDPLYVPALRSRYSEPRYDKKCLKKVLKLANKIVCVSDGLLESITEAFPKLRVPAAVITNGFDPDDLGICSGKADFEAGKMNFVYTGTLYHGKRSVKMLAIALDELIREGKIAKDDVAIHYAGSDFPVMLEQLRGFGLSQIAKNHGFVSRERALSMQRSATAQLLLSWNESNYRGVLPGKLYEYMSAGAPIIALITGDEKNSEARKIIENTDVGIAAEEAGFEKDLPILKDYIIKLHRGELTHKRDVEKYNYKSISERYIRFIEN